MAQKYTSKETSINSKKLPAIYGRVSIPEGKTVIDYGCGRYFDTYELPFQTVGYDPFWKADGDLLNGRYDYALCSNVLNVVMERENRLEILRTLKTLAPMVYITVYEGNGSGKGKATKADCYQLNWRRCDYIPELVEVFGAGNVRFIKGGVFECRSKAD